MSYEAREQQTKRDQEYQNLKVRMKNIEDQTVLWMENTTSLHTSSAEQTDKDDLVAMRTLLISKLRAALGI